MRKFRAVVCCALLLLAVRIGHCQQVLWQFTNDFPTAHFYTSPTVDDHGTIYLGSSGEADGTNGHGLYAIAPTGTKRWFFAVDSMVYTSPTVGANSNIYFGTLNGTLYALNPDGTLAWDYQTGAEHVRGIALAEDGTIYCTVRRYSVVPRRYRAKLCAINPDGSKKWEFTVPGEAVGSPVVSFDGTIYWAAADKFYAVNPDGTKYWEFPLINGEGAAIGADGTVYVSGYLGEGNSRLESMCAFNPDGTLEWTATPVGGSVVLDAGKDIFALWDGLWAFDLRGLSLWTTQNIRNVGAGVVSSDGSIYVVSATDGLSCIGANGGTRWQLVLPTEIFSSPVLVPDGTMYVSGDKRFYAIKVPCGMANSPWPMSGHDLRRTGRAGIGSPVCPCLSAIRLGANRGFQLTMVGETGGTYRIDTSTNLIDWSPWTSFVASNLVTHLTDSSATNLPFRFYRAISP